MKTFTQVLAISLFMLFCFSCSKDEKIPDPVVSIITPLENQVIQLPNTIEVDLTVQHVIPIEYIRVSIINKDLTPLSEIEYIHPSGETFSGKVNLFLSNLPTTTQKEPYYIHIVTDDGNNTNHDYLEIKLINSEIKFQGYAIIEKKQVNSFEIGLFDNKFQNTVNVMMDGTFSGIESSQITGSLYVTTEIPELATAIDFYSGETIWQNEAQLPYPEFTGLKTDETTLYLSTAIGRIIGVTEDYGSQIFHTNILPDTIPHNIAITENYLLADHTLRTSGKKVWVSFYKATGSKYQIFLTNYNTVNIFSITDNKAIIFANSDNSAEIITFDIESNLSENQISAASQRISKVCKIDNNNYLFSDNKSIYTLNIESNSYNWYYDSSDSIIDLKFEPISQTVYILTSTNIQKIHYPEYLFFETFYNANNLIALELIYDY